MKTYTVKANDITRDWYVVDADEQILGRLATRIATILRGKHKPQFSPHLDLGDHVVVVNAERVRLTGRKPEQKSYFRHSRYPGGAKVTPFKEMIERKNDVEIEAYKKLKEAEVQATALQEISQAEAAASIKQAEALRTQAESESDAEKLRADATRASM